MKARKFVTGIQNAMVLVLFLGAPLSTNGQVESGRFVGRITDVQGASVPRAIVKATNTGTNIVQSAITDSSGDFVITPVSAGVYSLSVTANTWLALIPCACATVDTDTPTRRVSSTMSRFSSVVLNWRTLLLRTIGSAASILLLARTASSHAYKELARWKMRCRDGPPSTLTVEGLIVAKVLPVSLAIHRLLIKSVLAGIATVRSKGCDITEVIEGAFPCSSY